MINLFMDTSTERGIVGLAQDNVLIEAIELPLGLQNSQFLFPAIIELLKRRGLATSQLQLISAGVGPGSYTGMRVACATAQGLAYALKLPLVGFSSLEGFAPVLPSSFAVVLDAKYGGVYLARGHYDGVSLSHEAPQVMPMDEAKQLLKEIPLLITPSASPKLILAFPHLEERAPLGNVVANLTFQKFQQGDFSLKAELKLLYLRKTQAEEERNQIR